MIPAVSASDAWIEGAYRYSLTRRWAEGPILVSIMQNPSTADAVKPDPTLLRNIHFAYAWGFGGLEVVSPFALRSPSPKALLAVSLQDAIGLKNDLAIEAALARGDMFLCAWGNPPCTPGARPDIVGRIVEVEREVLRVAKLRGVPAVCLGRTMHGWPKHPLARGVHRVPDSQSPLAYGGNQS